MMVYIGLWFMAISALVVIMVDYSHTLTNHYHWQIHALVQNHWENHLSDMHTFHHSAMVGTVSGWKHMILYMWMDIWQHTKLHL
jgi:hypothetical protein